MSKYLIASKLGLLSQNLINLYNGVADIGTASKIGVITSTLQEFLDGKANITMASKLGLLSSDLQIILNQIGRQGSIGLILGLLLKK